MRESRWFKDELGATLAERTALLAAIASTGRTFSRSLMPRTTVGQALATGLTGSVNYGLLATSQSALWAGAATLAPALLPTQVPSGEDPVVTYRNRIRLLAYGTYAVSGLAARPLLRLVPQVEGEPVLRGVARAGLQRLELASALGLVVTGLADATYTHLEATQSPRRRRAIGTALMLVGGTALATTQVHLERRRRARATGEEGPGLAMASVGAGAATALGLTVLGKSEAAAARGIGALLEPAMPRPAGNAIGHTVCLAGLGVGLWQGMEYLYRNTERAGSTMEVLNTAAPADVHVSGGPASSIAWETMTREGRRFAAVPLSGAEIVSVMGRAQASPVRVFVPLAASDTAAGRAGIALAEMDALGAFDRSVVVLCSPTGTGYINYVMAEAVEYLTRGDCAIVTTQYSLRPSFLSLDRVKVGRHNARALFNAVHERVLSMPEDRRPRIVAFGESLGAHTAQDVALHQGVGGLTGRSIERALFIGTPDGSKWAQEWRADPTGTDPEGRVVEVDSYEEFSALPEGRRRAAQFFLISHHEDPITKFGPELAIERPGWLDPDRSKRPPGIPPEVDWRPLTTFFVTVADIINAESVVPGTFGSEGHDYRGDLARFVSTAYDLPCTPEELARIEAALRARELHIAESRLVADVVEKARIGVESTMSGWGVGEDAASALIVDEVARARSAAARMASPSSRPSEE